MPKSLEEILTADFIARVESFKEVPRRTVAYVSAVQDAWGTHPQSVHWDAKEHMALRERGMPSAGEIVDYLASVGVGRYR